MCRGAGAVGAWVCAHLCLCVCGRQITAGGGCPFGDGVGTFLGASPLAVGGPSGIWSPGTQQRAGPLTRTHSALRVRPQPPASLSLQGSVPRQPEAPGQPGARGGTRSIKAEGHGEGEKGPARGGGGRGRGSSARASAGGAGSEQVCPAAHRWQRAGARTPGPPRGPHGPPRGRRGRGGSSRVPSPSSRPLPRATPPLPPSDS